MKSPSIVRELQSPFVNAPLPWFYLQFKLIDNESNIKPNSNEICLFDHKFPAIHNMFTAYQLFRHPPCKMDRGKLATSFITPLPSFWILSHALSTFLVEI